MRLRRGVSPELIGTVLTGACVLLGVWRLVDSSRRELEARLGVRIDAINTRIDNILLADRKA